MREECKDCEILRLYEEFIRGAMAIMFQGWDMMITERK